MSDTTFRTAQEPVNEPRIEPKRDMVVPEKPTVEVPVSAHYEIKGYPYTAEYFGISNIWDKPDVEMKDDVLAIESAYQRDVRAEKVKDGKDSYKAFIEKAEKITDTKFAPPATKIAKIARYVKFLDDLQAIDRRQSWQL